MPEIHIQPAIATDIPRLASMDPHYTSEHTWQMEIQPEENGRIGVAFREIRLPRMVKVEYPRKAEGLLDHWTEKDGLLVAHYEEEIVGYVGMMLNITPVTTWVTDLVVLRRYRRQGIGTTLLYAAQDWGLEKSTRRIICEMQPKNYPGIQMMKKLGFDFCGFNDDYFINHDIGLFFSRSLR